jgi:hypothetical protein
LANRTFRYFEVYLATVLIYLALTTLVYFGVKYLEKRFALVDLLTTKTRTWSPFARRRATRLRALQAQVEQDTRDVEVMEIPTEEMTDEKSPELERPGLS